MGVFHFFLKYLLMVFAQPHNTLTVQSTGNVLKPLPNVSLVLTPWSFDSCLPASLLLVSLRGAGGILEVMLRAAVVLLASCQGELVAGLAPCPRGHQIAPRLLEHQHVLQWWDGAGDGPSPGLKPKRRCCTEVYGRKSNVWRKSKKMHG